MTAKGGLNGPPLLRKGLHMAHRSRLSRCILANYRYEKDKAIATYVQDENPILQECHESRENQPGQFDRRDLDMGYKLASIPRIVWLDIQRLGIENDVVAIANYLKILKSNTGKDYFSTKKRLV